MASRTPCLAPMTTTAAAVRAATRNSSRRRCMRRIPATLSELDDPVVVGCSMIAAGPPLLGAQLPSDWFSRRYLLGGCLSSSVVTDWPADVEECRDIRLAGGAKHFLERNVGVGGCCPI